MSDKINIQDTFLNYVRKNKIPVTVFLLNGVKLTGIVACFDRTCLVLKRETYAQLVYKHAISTFSPHAQIPLFNWDDVTQQDNQQQNNKKSKKQNVIDTEEDFVCTYDGADFNSEV